MNWIIANSVLLTTITIVLISLLFSVYIYLKSGSSRLTSHKPCILLLGIKHTGKTSVLLKLKYPTSTPESSSLTVTSTHENTLDYFYSNKSVSVIDIPGHPKLRASYLDHIRRTKRVLFFIDATFPQINQTAEYFYEVITNNVLQKKGVHVMVACHKSDELHAHPMFKLKSELENEMRVLARSRMASVEQHDEEITFNASEEYDMDTFSFDGYTGKIQLSMKETSCTEDMSEIIEFIEMD